MQYPVGTTVFTDWTVTRGLGEGSFGTVYEIEKTNYGITTHSALKVIQVPRSAADIRAALGEGMDEKTVTSYFQGIVDEIVREIAVMAALKGHSNIVSCEDYRVVPHAGEIGWDILIRMELLTPLSVWRLEHPMDEAEIRRMGVDLCKALVFCQKQGLIHRDIKPENIFVGSDGQFKLGDFGVARSAEKTAGGMSRKGTESYMAPEVYLGKAYGASVDIYSLGLVLYQFLNGGRLPFLPPAPQPLSYADRENALALRIRGETLPAPSQASPEFAAVILKACAFDPKERWRTAAELMEALTALRVEPGAPVAAAAAAEMEDKTKSIWKKWPVQQEQEQEVPEKPAVAVFKVAPVTLEEQPAPKNPEIFEVTPVPEASSETPEPKNEAQEAASFVIEPEPEMPVPQETPQNSEKKRPKKEKVWPWLLVAAALLAMVLWVGGKLKDRVESQTAKESISEESIQTPNESTLAENSQPQKTEDGEISAETQNSENLPEQSQQSEEPVEAENTTDLELLKLTWDTVPQSTIVTGNNFTVAVKSDGTVIAAGINDVGECNVEYWSDIVTVSAGAAHTVGLKSDGTVVACGYSESGQCDVADWDNIVAISAGSTHTVGVKIDGTVIACGTNDDGRCNVQNWSNIVSVSSGAYHTVGLESDGTVIACGDNQYGQCNVDEWADIVAISAGNEFTVGLKSDGTVVACGRYGDTQGSIDEWTEIVAISAGYMYIVGLKSDGTVMICDNSEFHDMFIDNFEDAKNDVQDWTDVVAVCAGFAHVVGLKLDGTVVAAGDSQLGQCDVSDWTDIATESRKIN